MFDLKTVWICFIGLAFLPGSIKSGKIMKDDCSSRFLSSLIEAGYEIGNKVDLTINLKYEDVEGAKKKAAIKLRDKCSEPKILCDGEANVFNEKMVTGPLLLCSWKWNEKDDTTRNYVIVRLNHKKAIEVSGTISRNSENVFPRASDKGPLDFKFTTPSWKSDGDKKTYRVRREGDSPDYEENEEEGEGGGGGEEAEGGGEGGGGGGEEAEGGGEEEESHDDTEEGKDPAEESDQEHEPSPWSPLINTVKTTKTPVKTTPKPKPKPCKADSFVHATNKLSHALWMTWISFLIFVLK